MTEGITLYMIDDGTELEQTPDWRKAQDAAESGDDVYAATGNLGEWFDS